jgi:fatty-acyl-CoA synthase
MSMTVEARRSAIALRHPIWIEQTLDSYFDRATENFGDQPLILTDEGVLTYADVKAQSLKMADLLGSLGVVPGDRVGLLMPNSPTVAGMMLGIWRAGAIVVPINTLYRTEELGFVLKQSGCAVLIAATGFQKHDYLAQLDAMIPDWRAGEYQPFPELRHILIQGGDPNAGFSLETQLSGLKPAETPPAAAGPHDPAVIMYTSGTTGMAKGVLQTHDNLLRAAYAGAYHQAFEPGRRALFSLPLYHAFGLVVGLLSGWIVGGSIVPLVKFDAEQMLDAIGRFGINYLMAVPTMTVAMLQSPEKDSHDFSTLTGIHSAAAPTPSWVWREISKRFGCDEIFISYGMTETTATIICSRPGDPIDLVSTTLGVPVMGGVAGMADADWAISEFKTIDPETTEDLPEGAIGEICARTPMAALGYFRNDAETAKLFLPGGWLRTGDIGHFRPDGYLELAGRSKELYKSGGELISPKELEEALTACPGVEQAFVVGLPDPKWGEVGCAFIVRSDAGISETDILDFLKDRVARFKVPKHVLFIEAHELPKTGTGKVQKVRLAEDAPRRLGAAAHA